MKPRIPGSRGPLVGQVLVLAAFLAEIVLLVFCTSVLVNLKDVEVQSGDLMIRWLTLRNAAKDIVLSRQDQALLQGHFQASIHGFETGFETFQKTLRSEQLIDGALTKKVLARNNAWNLLRPLLTKVDDLLPSVRQYLVESGLAYLDFNLLETSFNLRSAPSERNETADVFLFHVQTISSTIQIVDEASETITSNIEGIRASVRAAVEKLVAGFVLFLVGSSVVILVVGFSSLRFVKERQIRQLQAAKEGAEEANRIKGEFLANVSHEIRTPMNAILGFTRLTLKTPLNRRQQEHLTKIDFAAQILLGLIDKILDAAKIEAGKLEIEAIEFSPDLVVDGVVTMLAPQAEEKGLDLGASPPLGLPMGLVGDPLRLGQVLTNLVGNAVKFTHRGKITVQSEVVAQDPQGYRLRFTVADPGIGMNADELARLFVPFHQADSSVTRRYGGTGLGLTISKALVEQMGGRIGVESRPGQGSTFWFEVPFPRAHGSPVSPGGEPRTGSLKTVRGSRVLVVEDNDLNRQVAGEMLRGWGVAVDFAENGLEAVDAVAQKAYDLVFMDLQMPVMGGAEATLLIRRGRRNPRVPIVAMTAHAVGNVRDECLAIGMNDCLTKPIQQAEVLAALEAWTTPRVAVIDFDDGIARIGGNPEVYHGILGQFVQDFARRSQEIREAVDRGAVSEALSLVHDAKGTAGNLSITALATSARHLEQVLRTPDSDPSEALAGFDRELSLALDTIRGLEFGPPVPSSAPESDPGDRTQTVLIVDDNPVNTSVLGELLGTEYQIVVATNGADALEIARSETPPDVILLDVIMPAMDGYEVCDRLSSDPRTNKIPVLFITAKVDDEDEALGFQRGAVDYIRKPFNPLVVRARVRTHAELKQKRDLLERVSLLDGLTQLPNRRCFDERFQFVWDAAVREQSSVTVMMVDVDYFKLYNDQYGHADGDACLVRVAQALGKVVKRKTDLIARYGGEEFVGIFLKAADDEAWKIAESLRRSVLALGIPHGGSPIQPVVTVSVGLATFIPSPEETPEKLLARADEALYDAKAQGRNRTVLR